MNASKGVGHKAVSGTAYLGVAQIIKIVVSILSVIVTARLLDPAQYGVAAMVAPITGFILIFQNLGLNQAVVQSKTITDAQTNALFWVNIAASAIVSLVFLITSPLVGLFYGDIRPGQVMAASAATVLITGLSLQHTALLNRNMKFKQIAVVDIANAVTTLGATAISAYLLRSYWAIWIGAFCAAIVNGVMVWAYSPWRPSLKPSFAGIRSLVTFGANVTGFNLLNYIARNVDNVLIAKIWGAGPVGLYDRSYKLMMFPLTNINAPLARVMLPLLARLRDEPERYRNAFLLSVRALMIFSVPGVIAAASTSDRLVPFLLGERWAAAAPIFFWLSLAAITQPLSNATGWLFMSSGSSSRMLKWGLFSSVTTVISFVIGVRWGPVGVAMAYLIGQLLRTPILYSICTKGTSVRQVDLYGLTIVPILAGAPTFLLVKLVEPRLETLPLLIFAVAVSYTLNVSAQLTSTNGRQALNRIRELLVSAVGSKLLRKST